MLEAWFRDRGSSEALIALEAGALVKAEIAPETQGSGETEPALEAGGSGETDPAPEAGGVGRPSYSFLPFFISLILVSYGLLYPTMV